MSQPSRYISGHCYYCLFNEAAAAAAAAASIEPINSLENDHPLAAKSTSNPTINSQNSEESGLICCKFALLSFIGKTKHTRREKEKNK